MRELSQLLPLYLLSFSCASVCVCVCIYNKMGPNIVLLDFSCASACGLGGGKDGDQPSDITSQNSVAVTSSILTKCERSKLLYGKTHDDMTELSCTISSEIFIEWHNWPCVTTSLDFRQKKLVSLKTLDLILFLSEVQMLVDIFSSCVANADHLVPGFGHFVKSKNFRLIFIFLLLSEV